MAKDVWVLDRIEDGEMAVLIGNDGETEVVIPAGWLPKAVREGHVIRVEVTAGSVAFSIDQDATDAALQRGREMRASIRKGPSGDIAL